MGAGIRSEGGGTPNSSGFKSPGSEHLVLKALSFLVRESQERTHLHLSLLVSVARKVIPFHVA